MRRFLAGARIVLAAGLLTGALPVIASAQGKYPDKPVRVILPFGAGGVADVTARLVADIVKWTAVIEKAGIPKR